MERFVSSELQQLSTGSEPEGQTRLDLARQSKISDKKYKMVLGDSETRKILREIQGGNTNPELTEKIIESNTGIILSIAKKCYCQEIPFQEIVQHGEMALLRAMKKFDPERKGVKFTTYATKAIQREIFKVYRDRYHWLGITGLTIRNLSKIRFEESRFSEPPTDEYLSQITGLPNKKIEFLRSLNLNVLSLSSPIGNDEDDNRCLYDLIQDPKTDISTEIENNLMSAIIRNEVKGIEDRTNRRIIEIRYGFDDGEFYAIAETAKILNRTETDVRNREKNTLEHLRNQFKEIGLDLERNTKSENNPSSPENIELFIPLIQDPIIRDIMGMRSKTEDKDKYPLREIGEKMGMSHEMVRKIQNVALNYIKFILKRIKSRNKEAIITEMAKHGQPGTTMARRYPKNRVTLDWIKPEDLVFNPKQET